MFLTHNETHHALLSLPFIKKKILRFLFNLIYSSILFPSYFKALVPIYMSVQNITMVFELIVLI